MKSSITVGTRGSQLALWQANYVKSQLEALGVEVTLQIIKTKGDNIQHLSFNKIEGKGFFTKETYTFYSKIVKNHFFLAKILIMPHPTKIFCNLKIYKSSIYKSQISKKNFLAKIIVP